MDQVPPRVISLLLLFSKISYTKQSREEGNTFFQNCYPKIISMLPGLMNLKSI